MVKVNPGSFIQYAMPKAPTRAAGSADGDSADLSGSSFSPISPGRIGGGGIGGIRSMNTGEDTPRAPITIGLNPISNPVPDPTGPITGITSEVVGEEGGSAPITVGPIAIADPPVSNPTGPGGGTGVTSEYVGEESGGAPISVLTAELNPDANNPGNRATNPDQDIRAVDGSTAMRMLIGWNS